MSKPERPTERHDYVRAPEEEPSNDGAFPYIVWATIVGGAILALISILTRGCSAHSGATPRHAKPANTQGTSATVKE